VLRNDPPRHRSAGLFDVCAAKRTRPRSVPAPARTGCEPYRLITGGWAPAWLVWNDSADPVVDNGLPDALADRTGPLRPCLVPAIRRRSVNPPRHGERLAKISCIGVRGGQCPFQLPIVKLVGERSQSRGHRGSLRNSCPGTRGSCKDYSEPLQQKCDALNSVANIRFTAAWLCSPAPAYDACSCEQESGTQLEPQVACLVQDSAQGEEKPGLCTAPQFGDLVSRQRDVLTGPAIHLRR
jgi:hypothetical protein